MKNSNKLVTPKLNIPQFLNTIIRNDFKSFLHKTFLTLHPTAKYIDNWHINLLCSYLSQVENKQMRRLLINIPPRSLKSVCLSVAWPAWLLGHNPSLKIIVASYSEHLSRKHSQDCRHVMNSKWYKEIFPGTVINPGENRANKFITDKMGFRFAASVNGTLTGEGADIIIVDDPHSPTQAASEKMRQKANTWFRQTLLSRLNDRQNGAILVVMQRLHCEDLSGMLLAKPGEWQHLKLPAVSDKDEEWQINGNIICQREKNKYLHPARENGAEIARLKEEIGCYGFAAQYQQEPLGIGVDSIIKGRWIKYYSKMHNSLPTFSKVYQSWDCAIKAGSGSHDYSVCTTWGEAGGRYYLIDVTREKLEYPYLLQQVASTAERFNPDIVIIEDKAAGQQLLQSIKARVISNVEQSGSGSGGGSREGGRRENRSSGDKYPKGESGSSGGDAGNYGENSGNNMDKQQQHLHPAPTTLRPIPAVGFNPRYDKKTRLMLVSPFFEAGKVLLPKEADWLEDLLYELLNFPNVRHDDQVDSISQFFLWLQCSEAEKTGKDNGVVSAENDDLNKWRVSGL